MMRLTNLATLARNWGLAIFDPRALLRVLQLPRFFAEFIKYRGASQEPVRFRETYPCLDDRVSKTPFDAHYFFQAAWLARRLARSGPTKHLDIGSDVRMISVLSAFVATEFVDYRPLPVTLDGLTCSQGDLLKLPFETDSVMSLSCLHVVEHIGLGRYGDAMSPNGSILALSQLQRVVKPHGRLYLSVPVGRPRICFNAHRVFSPSAIIEALPLMTLSEFSLVDDQGSLLQHQSLDLGAAQEYGCGLFVFEKKQ